MKKILVVFSALVLTGCCKDQIVASYPFSTFDRNIIPYLSVDNYTFVNEDGESIIAVSTPFELKTDTDRPGPESCDLYQYQELKSMLRFESLNFDIVIELNSNYQTDMLLFDQRYGEYNIRRLHLERKYGDFLSLEESLRNISIAGFEFENVLVFNDNNDHSELHKIILSPQNGIEFIEYDNGGYLKFVE